MVPHDRFPSEDGLALEVSTEERDSLRLNGVEVLQVDAGLDQVFGEQMAVDGVTGFVTAGFLLSVKVAVEFGDVERFWSHLLADWIDQVLHPVGVIRLH